MALFELPPWLVERIEYLLDPMRLLCVVLVLKFLHRVFVDFKLGQSTGQAEQLEREAKALRMQAAVMAVPSTFAKAAKMERQAIALEKEAERQRQAAGTPSAVARAAKVFVDFFTTWLGRLLVFGGFFAGGIRRPILFVPVPAVWPLASALKGFRGDLAAGAVSLMVWYQLCNWAATALWRRVIPG